MPSIHPQGRGTTTCLNRDVRLGILDQAARCAPDLLPPDVTDALTRRQQLRDEHMSAYRLHTTLCRTDKSSDRSRDNVARSVGDVVVGFTAGLIVFA